MITAPELVWKHATGVTWTNAARFCVQENRVKANTGRWVKVFGRICLEERKTTTEALRPKGQKTMTNSLRSLPKGL
ncbi:hypothetical protein GGR53DRAFT_486300 [Hypoxylon sp. FL1150]|nr:hypothetical protein GGR53DRAFT_486300 [Hypoxylon sp. FL1150]